jgi:hypothetical protein
MTKKRVVPGLVTRCLNKDEAAFSTLKRTKAKPRWERLKILSECRPQGCDDTAVGLFLWLIKVRRFFLAGC